MVLKKKLNPKDVYRLSLRFQTGFKIFLPVVLSKPKWGRSRGEELLLHRGTCGGAAPKASKGKGKGPPPPKVGWDDGMATTRMSRREGS